MDARWVVEGGDGDEISEQHKMEKSEARDQESRTATFLPWGGNNFLFLPLPNI